MFAFSEWRVHNLASMAWIKSKIRKKTSSLMISLIPWVMTFQWGWAYGTGTGYEWGIISRMRGRAGLLRNPFKADEMLRYWLKSSNFSVTQHHNSRVRLFNTRSPYHLQFTIMFYRFFADPMLSFWFFSSVNNVIQIKVVKQNRFLHWHRQSSSLT